MHIKTLTLLLILFISLNANDSYKEKKIYPMGKKIYEKRCKDIDVSSYTTKQNLQTDIKDKKLCKPLKEKYFDALVTYLWEVKRDKKDAISRDIIKVTKDAKCPICGMFVYKYPRWATKFDNQFFDGAKDMMKYYFQKYDKVKSKKMLVTDYYTQTAMDGKKAYYVIGSNVYGPMGNEFIPFRTLKEAKTFLNDHFGKKILRFNEINEDIVYEQDE